MQTHREMKSAILIASARASKAAEMHEQTQEPRHLIEESEALGVLNETANRALRTPAATQEDLESKIQLFKDKLERDGALIADDPAVLAELGTDLDSIIADALRLNAA